MKIKINWKKILLTISIFSICAILGYISLKYRLIVVDPNPWGV
ncbi:MAG: hypothetical protein ACTSWL_08210 [Promethearchaeota archaeon]